MQTSQLKSTKISNNFDTILLKSLRNLTVFGQTVAPYTQNIYRIWIPPIQNFIKIYTQIHIHYLLS